MSETLLMLVERVPAARVAELAAGASAAAKLVLPFEQREKTRQRARLSSGVEIGLQLPRGTVLRGGDRLLATDGTLVEVVAAREPVSTVRSGDLRQLARVAYHLGNRHVPLEVGPGWVRYRQDHVLDGMVEQLGLRVLHGLEPFEPEAGAYGGHSHTHTHGSDAPFLPAGTRADGRGAGGARLNLHSSEP